MKDVNWSRSKRETLTKGDYQRHVNDTIRDDKMNPPTFDDWRERGIPCGMVLCKANWVRTRLLARPRLKSDVLPAIVTDNGAMRRSMRLVDTTDGNRDGILSQASNTEINLSTR
jgi:hypothetical protein